MMNNQTIDRLSEMRLHAMNKAYQRQLELPAMQSLDFEERFSMMVDAQWYSRVEVRLKRLLKSSNLRESGACLEDIDYSPNRNLTKVQMNQLSDCSWIRNGQNLIITGATGTGKSYLLSALGREACAYNLPVRCVRVNRLITDLAIGRGDGSYNKIMAELKKPRLLILDDFAMQVLDPSACRDLLEVIEERYGKKSIAISAQLPIKHWHEMFEDPTIADAILDRLIHNSYKIDLTGPSKRFSIEEFSKE